MTRDYPEDPVGWRAGEASSTWYIRKGIVTETPPGSIALDRMEVDGGDVNEEITLPHAGRLNLSSR